MTKTLRTVTGLLPKRPIPRPGRAAQLVRQLPGAAESCFPSRSAPVLALQSRCVSTADAKASMAKSSSGVDDYMTSTVFDMMSLKDRVIVITGGAKGIGMALAFGVAEAGGKIAIIDAALEPSENYANLQRVGLDVRYYQSDVTDYDKLESTFGEIVKDFSRIDGIITAAGICPDQPFLERDPKSVKRCIEINNLGLYYSAQLAARQMNRQARLEGLAGAGSIVNIASVAAHIACKNQFTSDYSMSKGGVLALTKQLGVELSHVGIRVNCISPGYILTDLMVDIVKQRPNLGEALSAEPPMKRMGLRKDLKAAAVFLLSDASAYMTSGEMLITGGLHAGKVY